MHRNGYIDDELKKYLVPKLQKPDRLKGSPKLHKERKPLRTIVNGIGAPTEKMTEIAEFQLNEYVEQTPSYIKDKTDFLRKLDKIKGKSAYPKLLSKSERYLAWNKTSSYLELISEIKFIGLRAFRRAISSVI